MSSYAHRGRKPKTYTHEIDAVVVYCPDNDCVYLVPVLAAADCKRACFLRVEATRNGQAKNVRWAGQFLIG